MAKKKSPKKLEPLELINDEPICSIEEDTLGVLPYGETIAAAALGTEGPFTIGAFGEWGTGKTSLMRLTKDLLEKKGSNPGTTVTVWFNAWRCENEDHPILPLIGSVVKAVEARTLQTARGKVSNYFRKFVLSLRAIAYGFSAKAKVGLPGAGEVEADFGAREMMDRYEKLSASRADTLFDKTRYFRAFEALETAARESEKDGCIRIVVFIDDLDRCFPEKAVKLLEAIKLVLSQKGFIFVIGVAHTMLEQYVTILYQKDYGFNTSRGGRSYLDKIVQLPLPLPTHESYFATFLEKHINANPVLCEFEKVLVSEIVPHLGSACHNNPRSAVRLLNNLIVDIYLWKKTRKEKMPLDIVAVNRTMQQYNEALYRDLVELRPWLGRILLEELRSIEKDEEQQQKDEALAPDKKKGRDSRRAMLKAQWFEQLFENRDLCEFLRSSIGEKWLADEEVRKLAHNLCNIEQDGPSAERAEVDAIAQAIRDQCEQDSTTADKLAILLIKEEAQGNWSNLEALISLEVLDLSRTQVTDEGLVHLKSLSSLRRLDLDGTQITNAGLVHLKSLSSLRSLDLNNTQVTDEGLAHLESLSSLQGLMLNGTQVTDEGMVRLKSFSSLEILTLNRTQVADEGLVHLKGLSSLLTLTLGETQVKDEGLVHLKNLSSLRWLDLRRTQVTDEGLVHLKSLSSLQWLYLMETKISDEGFVSIRKALPKTRVVR